MQVLMTEIQELSIEGLPTLRNEGDSLEDEILSKIGTVPESEQAQLLALAAPKLQDEKLNQAFDMLLRLEDNLSKGLALIDFLPYLRGWDSKVTASDEILRTIKEVGKSDKIELIGQFIRQLELKKHTKEYYLGYLTKVSKQLVEVIRDSCSFSLKEQISLEGKSFSLMYWHDCYKNYSLYPQEKERLLKEIKAIEKASTRYLALLNFLKEFPLEQEEINKLAFLGLNTLNECGDGSIRFKDKVELLAFLPEMENKRFGKRIYEEAIADKEQSVTEYLESLSSFAAYYGAKDKLELYSEEERLDVYAMHDLECIVGHFSDCEGKESYKYFEIIEFLMRQIYFNSWIKDALLIMENIKCPATKADAIILILSKLDRLYRIQKKVRTKALEIIFLVTDQQERITLTAKILGHISKKKRQEVASTLIEEINLLSGNMQKAEFLAELVPYLTCKLRKQAFEIAKNISNEFDRTWACVGFIPYLSKGKKRRVIQDALELTDKPDHLISVAQKALIIKQLIKFTLAKKQESSE